MIKKLFHLLKYMSFWPVTGILIKYNNGNEIADNA